MKAELKNYYSPDVNDLSQYKPEDVSNFGFFLQLYIGPQDLEGEESFGLIVCSSEWLNDNPKYVEYPKIILNSFNHNDLMNIIKDKINKCEGNDWDTLAKQLSNYFKWEFDDFN